MDCKVGYERPTQNFKNHRKTEEPGTSSKLSSNVQKHPNPKPTELYYASIISVQEES
jgi:hypothetical protein